VDTLGAVVLSGGRSRRFGSDKTRALVDGVSLLERVLGVVDGLAEDGLIEQVLVVGDWAPAGVRVEPEPVRGLGPLAGLAHGLAQIGTTGALVLAADHPDLRPALLRSLIARSETPASSASVPDAVVPVGPTGPEPLVAWYRTEIAGRAAARLAEGERSLRGFLSTLEVASLEPVEWRLADPEGRSFRDVDTPDDLRR